MHAAEAGAVPEKAVAEAGTEAEGAAEAETEEAALRL